MTAWKIAWKIGRLLSRKMNDVILTRWSNTAEIESHKLHAVVMEAPLCEDSLEVPSGNFSY
jgi:hypothetical protein